MRASYFFVSVDFFVNALLQNIGGVALVEFALRM
jgi:hypothetical protein